MGLFTRIHLGLEMYVCTQGGSWYIPNTDSEPGKARKLVKRNLEDRPYRSESNHQKSATLSEPIHVSIQTYCILFSPNKYFSCFTTFHLYVEIHFYTACHCKLVPGGLVARIQHFPWHCLTSNSGWQLKSCFKLLQAEATWDHCHFLT